MIHWELHSSCDLYGHISLIVMGGVGSYLPVPGVFTLVVSVVLDSRCSVVCVRGHFSSFSHVLLTSCT